MKITKVRYAGDKVTVCYEADDDSQRTAVEVAGKDEPHTSFREAMAALIPTVAAVLDLPLPYFQAEGTEARQVTVKYYDADQRGFVISAVRPVEGSNSPFVIHTPHMKEARQDEDGELSETGLAEQDVEAIDLVLSEAQRYLDGHRAQGDLFPHTDTPVVEEAIGTRDEQPEPAVV